MFNLYEVIAIVVCSICVYRYVIDTCSAISIDDKKEIKQTVNVVAKSTEIACIYNDAKIHKFLVSSNSQVFQWFGVPSDQNSGQYIVYDGMMYKLIE